MNDFTTLAERYVTTRAENGRFDKHRKNTLLFHLREFVGWLIREMGLTHPSQVSLQTFEAWHRYVAAKRHKKTGLPLQPNSAYVQISVIRGFCAWLASDGYLPTALLDAYPHVRPPASRLQVALRDEEVRRYLDRLPLKTPQDFLFRALAEFIYSTGVRACEAVSLDVDDVDLEQAQARVMGKGRKERMVPIGRTARHHVEVYLAGVRPLLLREKSESALWLNYRGGRLCYWSLRARFDRQAAEGDGRRVMPHVLRRSCATELLRSGASVWDVRELLGHDDLETIEGYALLDLADLKQMHARCHPRDLPPEAREGIPLPGLAQTSRDLRSNRWVGRRRN